MKLRLMIFLLVLLLPLGSSSIFIEHLNEVYNYGDQLVVQTKIVPSVTTSSHYTVDLVCGRNVTINIFNSFFDLPANVEKPVTISTQILDPLLQNITSTCFLKANFASESIVSSSFSLSKDIDVRAKLESDKLSPGKSLFVDGTAMKESGTPVNGFVELFVNSLNLYKSSVITNGLFNITLILPTDSKSGKHNINISVHNTDYNSKKINFGYFSESFTVDQILKDIKISSKNTNVNPDTDFLFQIDAVDQANDPMILDVSLVIYDPKGIPFVKKIIKSGEEQKLHFFLNNTPGYWNLEASVDGISKRKLFYLLEVQKIQTSLIDNTLFVTNIGNSRYNGPLEVTIGSQVEVKQINLDIGETQKLNLYAPDGEYSISISDGGQPENLGSTFLTGNAIKITDLREDIIGTITNPWIWWLAVILFVLLIVMVRIKLKMQKQPPVPMVPNMKTTNIPMKNEFSLKNTDLSKKDVLSVSSPAKNTKFDSSWLSKPTPKINPFVPKSFDTSQAKVAPSNLFGDNNQGIRERAVAIALHLVGSAPHLLDVLTSALSIARESGAKIYIDGEYKIILFSPKLNKRPDNESDAINVARRIQALLLEHVKTYNDGLFFGIGISNGEIISEIVDGKFHFTSTGNLISLAKRIAQSSKMKLLVSDSVRRKVISTVKTEKSSFQGVWEVVRVVDHSKDRDFVKRFSERNK